MEQRPLTVVLIDDHTLFARGLQLLLHATSSGQVRVLETVDQPVMAVGCVARSRPDAALVDLAMPAPGGIEVIRELRRRFPTLRVIALSGLTGVEAPLAALRAGADGFLPKSADPDELVAPLVAMLQGWLVVPSELLLHLLTSATRSGAAVLDELDGEERRLWRSIARGARNDELARELHLSERSVKRLVAALLRKIGAGNRIQAAALAGTCGLLDDPPSAALAAHEGPAGDTGWHQRAPVGA